MFNDNHIIVKNIQSGKTFESNAELSHHERTTSGTTLSFRSMGASFTNPFNHPRLIVSDLSLAVELLKTPISKVYDEWKIFRPAITLHPLRNLANELTHAEASILLQVGAELGAREVYIWIGKELTDEDFSRRDWRAQGKLITGNIKTGHRSRSISDIHWV